MAPSSLSLVSEFWTAWGLRITSYLSFSANVLLVVFARSRRHSTSRWQRAVLWLAYQTAEITATYALGDLSLSGTDGGPSRQQQLVAFWAPFLLLHLGGPDNITAYALEDNNLSKRKWYEICAQLVGIFFTLYNYVYLGGSRALLAASVLMALLALAKYAEKACALYQGKLGNMRRSSSDGMSSPASSHMDLFVSSSRREVDNEQALLYDHRLFRFCKNAMFDSSVHYMAADDDGDSSGGGYPTSVKIFSLEWKGVFKVVEMELSLMYDILYTKAAVVHTWRGYLLRLISPIATAVAASLFWTWAYPNHGQLEPADVRFTYIMLATAFLLDALWLVKALGSSWTYSFLAAQPPELLWLQHGVVCSGKWRQLHRVVASLDPCWLVFGKDPGSYRRWSGVTGRYNLLQECTDRRAEGSNRVPSTSSPKFLTSLFGCQKDQGVKEMLFQRIKQRLPLPERYQTHPEEAYDMVDITTRWGHVAVRKFPDKSKLKGLKLKQEFGREFQEDVLVWHIGTSIFLHCTDQPLPRGRHVKAIELLSEYLMFLVAARPHMLPSLVLRSLFEDTFRALGQEWRKAREAAAERSNGRRSCGAWREKKLAMALHDESLENQGRSMRERDGRNRLMLDGIEVGMELLKFHEDHMDQMLELIFDVWVDKLMYASTRCSRESHAKQLSRGGELTTIVWIMVQHAGLFRIGETNDPTSDRTSYIPKRGEDEMKKKEKEAEEKKKKEEEEKVYSCGDERPPRWPEPPRAAPWEEYIGVGDGRPPRPLPPPPSPAPMLSERARKRRARTTMYSTLYPA